MDTTPVLRDLRFLEPLLRQIPLQVDTCQWNIPFMKDDDVAWSIALAYLNSFLPSSKDDVTDHVKCLLGKKVGKDASNCVKKCNPFLYRSACVCNETIIGLVDAFRSRIQEYCQTHWDSFASKHDSYLCLQASSILLSCNVILIQESIPDISIDIKLFPDGVSVKIQPLTLIFFLQWKHSSDNPGVFKESISFCIPKEIGYQKQKQALQEILLKANFAGGECNMKHIKNILPDIRDNFISSLLGGSLLSDYIPFIYKSPYVLSKLRDAAIETDPRIENKEGKSALFFALTRSPSDLLYFLYDHVANACLLTQGSIRSPDPVIVMNLIYLKDLLVDMRNKLTTYEMDTNEKKNSFRRLDELCRFNDFQTNTCRSINNIRQRINYYEDCSKKYEATQRRDVIVNILQSYSKYFDWSDDLEQPKIGFSLFQEFYLHRDYFDNLDFCSAVMFFDNLYLLKERLCFSDKSYLKIESQFFFFIYCRKYFESVIRESPRLKIASRMIIFQERLSLKTYISSFKEALEKKDICEENTVEALPESAVRTLTNIPQIYGEFLVLRLKHYLDAATNIRTIDMKAILIIQRVLQVVGESLKESDFKSVQKILPLIFSDEVVTSLKQIRNELAHPKDFKIPYRNSAEENTEMFSKIKSELATLKGVLCPIFAANRYAMDQYVLLLTQRAIHKARRNVIPEIDQPNLMAILAPNEVDEGNSESSNFQNVWEKYFQEMYNSFSSKIASVNRDEKVITKHSVEQYRYMLKNIFCTIRRKLNYVKKNCSNMQEGIVIMDDFFWSVEYLLIHITKDKNINTDHRRKLLNMIKDRQTLFMESRKREHCKNKKDIAENLICVSMNPKVIPPKKPDFAKLYNSKPEKDLENHNSADKKFCNNEDLQPVSEAETSSNKEENCSNAEELKEKQNFEEKTESILSNYEKTTEEIFFDSHCNNSKNNQFNFDSIGKFRKILKGCYYINWSEKKRILNSIPEDIQNGLRAKHTILSFLGETESLTKKEFNKEINKLPLKDKDIQELSNNFEEGEFADCLYIIDSIHDHTQDLKVALEKNEVGKKTYDAICNNLKLPESSIDILSNIVLGQKCKRPGNQLEFLRNRIKQMKSILIDENRDIKPLWETARSSRKKSYVQERIVHVYLNDAGVQASVEMLLFDCMNILKTKDLQNLCRKTTNLFNGINLRNVLAHGNPLLESLGRLLDPYDLPSELVRKMLDLVSDLDIIDCMIEILNQSGYTFLNFMQIMNDEEEGEFKNLRERISDCDNWRIYALLIPQGERIVQI